MPRNVFSKYGRLAAALPMTLGKVFFVHASGTALASELQNWLPPDEDGVVRVHTTLDSAVDASTASQGDVILVLEGHAETVSSATATAFDKAGVTVLGLGKGNQRPTITMGTGTDTTIAVSAAGVTVQNCVFVANYAAVVAPFTVGNATDFALLNCEFRDSASNLNFVNIVDTDATSNHADGLRIEDCKRVGAGATTNTTVVKMDGTNTRVSIKRNYVRHAATTGGGVMIIATGKVVTDLEMTDNVCLLTGATNQTTGILITTDGSTNSGMIARNLVQGLDATTEILVTASSGFSFSQNYYSGAADASGYLLPAADS